MFDDLLTDSSLAASLLPPAPAPAPATEGPDGSTTLEPLASLVLDAVALLDAKGEFIQVSEAGQRFLGCSAQYLCALNLLDVVFQEDHPRIGDLLRQAAAPGAGRLRVDLRVLVELTRPRWVELSICALDGRQDAAFVVGLQDIDARKAIEHELRLRSTRDRLTKLPNRQGFLDYLQGVNPLARPTGLAVAVFDIEGFRRINQELGRVTGDALLVEVANRLLANTRQQDLVTRLEADRFGVIFNGVTNAEEFKTLIERTLALLSQPYATRAVSASVTVRAGAALFREQWPSPESMLDVCEQALADAKTPPIRSYEIRQWTEPTRIQGAIMGKLMQSALVNGEFLLHFQPIVCSATSQVKGVEALMRWTHEGRNISPVEFIPVAEASGLVVTLGSWALRFACAQLREWDRMGYSGLYCTVNVSARQFADPRLVDTVAEALSATGIEPHRLVLEITESMLMRDVDSTVALLNRLRALGVRIAVDDFGTGYSSLNYLKTFPLSALKLDRSFVNGVPHDVTDIAIARTVIALAQALGIDIVAEGVENQEQFDWLAGNGCNLIQGYYISRPLDAQALPAVFDKQGISSQVSTC